MNAELEAWIHSIFSKMQDIIVTFKNQLDKQTSRVVYIEGKLEKIEKYLKTKPKIDEGDMVDIRARMAYLEKEQARKNRLMFNLITAMKEKLIGFDSRIALIEEALKGNENNDKDTEKEMDNEDVTEVSDKDEGKDTFPPKTEVERAEKKVDELLKDLKDTKDHHDVEGDTDEDDDKETEEEERESWKCPICGAMNTNETECAGCGTEKTD